MKRDNPNSMDNPTLTVKTEDAFETEIREGLAKCDVLVAKAKLGAEKAIQEAIKVGRSLVGAKLHFKGRFVAWLGEKFPNVHRTYLNRLQQLAEAVDRGVQLTDPSSLRQAFIQAGILPRAERDPNSQNSHIADLAPWLTRATQFTAELSKLKEEAPIDEWPDSTRSTLKEKLRPMAELYALL